MLRRYSWEKAKEKLQHYRRRAPEASPLYQIVYHSRDDLQFQWEARFQHHYGGLRDEVVKTFDEYLNLVRRSFNEGGCGILAHGFGRELSRTVPRGYIAKAASTRSSSRSLASVAGYAPLASMLGVQTS